MYQYFSTYIHILNFIIFFIHIYIFIIIFIILSMILIIIRVFFSRMNLNKIKFKYYSS